MTYKPHILLMYATRELFSLTFRLGEKIKDKFIWLESERKEAKHYLVYFKHRLKHTSGKNNRYYDIFGMKGKFSDLSAFKRGYSMKSITFKTIVAGEEKRWVLKIGHRISPVIDLGDPGSFIYYNNHKKHVEILQKEVETFPELSHLLPAPYEIMWARLHHKRKQPQTILILMPYIKVNKLRKIIKKLTPENKKILLAECAAFRKLYTTLVKKHNLQLDLFGEGNLVITEKADGYHLILLDLGLIDLKAPLPITQTIMHLASIQTISSIELLIKRFK